MKKYKLNLAHLFKYKGKNYLYVTNNSRAYQCDDSTYSYLLQLYSKHQIGQEIFINDEKDILPELIDSGVISDLRDYSKTTNYLPNQDPLPPHKNIFEETYTSKKHVKVSNIVLELANDCNLNCVYCYGAGGGYGRKRELMSEHTALKAIRFLFENCEDVKQPHVTFFGGEPLLNFQVLKKVVEYCHTLERNTDKRFTFSITTNGTICNDEIEAFFISNKIHTMISIDGPQTIQDELRPSNDKKSSFEKIIKNIPRFKKANGGHLTARATICYPYINFVEIKESLLELGFTEVQMSLVDIHRDSPLFLGSFDNKHYNKELYKEYQELAEDYISSVKSCGKSNNRLFNSYIQDLYFKNMRSTACGAGIRGFAIGTDELIYPCHRYMGMQEYAVGTLTSGIDYAKTIVFRHSNVFEKEECKKCWAKFMCGGGCSHICVNQEKDIKKAPAAYCETYRKVYELAIYIYTELKQWDDDVFRKAFERREANTTIL